MIFQKKLLEKKRAAEKIEMREKEKARIIFERRKKDAEVVRIKREGELKKIFEKKKGVRNLSMNNFLWYN